MGPRNCGLDGMQIPKGNGQFSGVVWAIQKHWQSSLQQSQQRRCGVRCKGHSIANNIMQQMGSFSMPTANSILKFSGFRRCGFLAVKQMVGLHSMGEV